jgi:hypothetical protein
MNPDLSEKIALVKKPFTFLFLLAYHLILLPIVVALKVIIVLFEWITLK